MTGYYWRDFDGSIPQDAYPGGRDINNRSIYIGQVLSNNLLIPAKIYYNKSKAFYEYAGKEYESEDNVKVLCTQQPENFKWIPTNNEDLKNLTDVFLVKGGFEPGCTTYIGRLRFEGEVLVGKALTGNPLNQGCYVTKKGHGHRHSSFEVLSFALSQSLLDVRFAAE